MAGEETPSAWELMRLLRKIDDRLEQMETRMVSGDVFKAHQEAIERRFQEVERDQREWTVESRGEHVRLDAKVDTVNLNLRADMDAERLHREKLERGQREQRNRNWLTIGVAVLASLLSLGGGLILQAAGGGA